MRAAKQQRSAERQHQIAEAAIAVIARHGVAAVTHRMLAREANVSLAATTYHFRTKLDIIAEASARLLDGYTEAFRRFLERGVGGPTMTFRDFAMRLAINAAEKHHERSLAWCEIVLDAARRPESRGLAKLWFDELTAVWLRIAHAFDVTDAAVVVRSAIDTVIGLLFVVIPLGIDEQRVAKVLFAAEDPDQLWHAGTDLSPPTAKLVGRKGAETRQRLLSAAVTLLIEGGIAAVTYRAVAHRAAITPSAPIHHFPTIDTLLNAAQKHLFEASKDRYRMTMEGAGLGLPDIDRLADLTTAVFLREATEFGAASLASYPIWLEAAREAQLRPTIWAAVADQNRAWRRLLDGIAPNVTIRDALLTQCLFRGKLIRILATGASTIDLADIRGEFITTFRALGNGTHWAEINGT